MEGGGRGWREGGGGGRGEKRARGCGPLLVSPPICNFCLQSLLENHEWVESEVKGYSSEIERLKVFSRKVIEGSTSSGFVSSPICVSSHRTLITQK